MSNDIWLGNTIKMRIVRYLRFSSTVTSTSYRISSSICHNPNWICLNAQFKFMEFVNSLENLKQMANAIRKRLGQPSRDYHGDMNACHPRMWICKRNYRCFLHHIPYCSCFILLHNAKISTPKWVSYPMIHRYHFISFEWNPCSVPRRSWNASI